MSSIIPLEGDLMPVADNEFLGDPPMIIDESVDPSAVIKTTQSIRIAMAKKHLRHGVPAVGEDSRDFLMLLRDLDGAALTTRKIDVEERQIGESERLAQAQNELLRMLNGANPFVSVDLPGSPSLISVHRESTVGILPKPELVPGIDAQGTQPVDADKFLSAIAESETANQEDASDD
ncbi:hypothetical protein D9M68_17420 [compost metagenome]